MSRHRPRRRPFFEFTPPQSLREWMVFLDWRELVTGLLVVLTTIVGSQAAPWLFAQAQDVLLTQLVFEMPMALLAVVAGYAEARRSRFWRGFLLFFGAFGVMLAGLVKLLELDAPGGLIAGLWLIYARLAPPAGVAWFSALHCKCVHYTAGAAWALLIVALLVMMVLLSLAPSGDRTGAVSVAIYALCWAFYYTSLAFVLPVVRQYHQKKARPPVNPPPADAQRKPPRKTGKSSAARAR